MNKYHTVLCANYRNKKKDQKVIGVSLNSCPKAMRPSDKYQNFLIFIPLPRHLSLKRLNSKTCLIIMNTKMQVISLLWIFRRNKINRTGGYQPLEELKYYWEFKRLAPKCLCLFDVCIPYICVYTFRCFLQSQWPLLTKASQWNFFVSWRKRAVFICQVIL